MTTITEVAEAMQRVLTIDADRLGRESGFIQRQRQFRGSSFVQMLVFGYLANPQASLGQLGQAAVVSGSLVSRQGIAQRFTRQAAAFLEKVLAVGVEQVIRALPVEVELLKRFTAVWLYDTSVIRLPGELAEVWRGCGSQVAALKIGLAYDLVSGQMHGPRLHPARQHDQSTRQAHPAPLAGSVCIQDLGYFKLKHLKTQQEEGVYWIIRLKAGTVVLDERGQRLDVAAWLSGQSAPQVECRIVLGQAERIPCRLVAQRVSAESATQRRDKLLSEAQRRQRPVSPTRLAWVEWNIVVTNVPLEHLATHEVFTLAASRWQVELIFDLWKTEGALDKASSVNPWQVLCHLYAKLLALLFQHWLSVVGCWQHAQRSLWQAAQVIRSHAMHLSSTLSDLHAFQHTLSVIFRVLAHACRIERRRDNLPTFVRWLSPPTLT
jgi:hypothetical protein